MVKANHALSNSAKGAKFKGFKPSVCKGPKKKKSKTLLKR